jgi:hypothetical protein
MANSSIGTGNIHDESWITSNARKWRSAEETMPACVHVHTQALTFSDESMSKGQVPIERFPMVNSRTIWAKK